MFVFHQAVSSSLLVVEIVVAFRYMCIYFLFDHEQTARIIADESLKGDPFGAMCAQRICKLSELYERLRIVSMFLE